MYRIYDDWTCPELEALKKDVLSNGFPLEVHDTTRTNFFNLVHHIQPRLEDTKNIPQPKSPLYLDIVKIMIKFCEENGVPFPRLSRSCINFTYPREGWFVDTHVDHDYPHLNVLFYLNESDGNTRLYYDDGEIEVEIEPKKNRVVVFDGCQHDLELPTKKERIVLICTIGLENENM